MKIERGIYRKQTEYEEEIAELERLMKQYQELKEEQ